MLNNYTVVIKEWREMFYAELLCHDVISLECGANHINVINVNKATVKIAFTYIMYHEFMVILKFPMANVHYFRQFMAAMDALFPLS